MGKGKCLCVKVLWVLRKFVGCVKVKVKLLKFYVKCVRVKFIFLKMKKLMW